jgi:hypothetical protein
LFQVTKNANLRIKARFKDNLTETVNLLVYGEFESVLEITKQREVLLDYRM